MQATPITPVNGRPAGEVRAALLQACHDLTTPERAPTVRELAAAAGVSLRAATDTVKNLRRIGLLQIARDRRVDYRNKPVAEYVPGTGWVAAQQANGSAALAVALQGWGR